MADTVLRVRAMGLTTARMTATVQAAVVLSACGGTTAVPGADPAAPADLLLEPAELPEGFDVADLTIPELVSGNRASCAAAEYAEVDTDLCRPTADAGFIALLRSDNAALLTAPTAVDPSSDAEFATLFAGALNAATADWRAVNVLTTGCYWRR